MPLFYLADKAAKRKAVAFDVVVLRVQVGRVEVQVRGGSSGVWSGLPEVADAAAIDNVARTITVVAATNKTSW